MACWREEDRKKSHDQETESVNREIHNNMEVWSKQRNNQTFISLCSTDFSHICWS